MALHVAAGDFFVERGGQESRAFDPAPGDQWEAGLSEPAVIAMDFSLEPTGELQLPTPRPFGHFVAYCPTQKTEFAIVSEFRGRLAYFQDSETAQPFLRMLCVDAYRGEGRFDFRLYRWNHAQQGWEIWQRTIEHRTLGSVMATKQHEESAA